MRRISCSFLALLLIAGVSDARVAKLVIEHTQAAGAYTRVTGHFEGELDPKLPQNAIIQDLKLAPRNARGRVEYSATFTLLFATDPAKRSGVLVYEVPNRGNSPLNARLSEDEQNEGDAMLSSGWQGDLTPRPNLETITVPIAKNADGSSITGPVMMSLMNLPAGSSTASLEGGFAGLRYQRPVSLDTSKARLTRQVSEDGEVIPVRAGDWAFADCSKTPFPGAPDSTKICLKDGFEPDRMYRVVYTAKDPLVLAIGAAATRDIVSFFRYASQDDAGTANPLGAKIHHSIAFGTSQSGNFIKTFINLGFNQDEEKRIVWDGANPNIAARQNPLNFRFAVPGGAASLYEPGSEGVLWWSDYRDQERGRAAAGLLDRCLATKTCPKIMETFGATEFWGLRMSPGLVGTRADTDIPLPANVRRYYFPGVTHGGGRGGFEVAAPNAGGGRGCVLPDNPNSTAEPMRALRRALIDWVVKNIAPPESRYPRLDRGELVPPQRAAMGFPAIPGYPLPDDLINTFYEYDLGQAFQYNDLSGVISLEPPVIRRTIPMLVPKTDTDGNEIGGIPSVLHQAPLATYLGWNVTASGYLKGRGCGFAGGMIPFPRTKAEREATGDPRPSIEERYGTHEGYVARVKAAAQQLVKERFLIQEDADRLVSQAEAGNVLK
ncbi:MAG TPA: alpha/beta hydrolase domain-containing protein [Bryobacteraceae bacterium]|nr:alpha/beta hydrolase domain-containing protein [Bryobacteraceae bacterium]